MIDLKGSGVALITPFTDNNKINYDKDKELIEYHISNDTDFIVVCGTTGESSTLSNNEKKQLMEFSVKCSNGRIPIICGTGSNNTKATIELSMFAKEIGCDGILVVTPYYNKCNEEGLYKHYKTISEAVYPLPVILYNVPSRTGVDISLENIVKLSKIPNIIGIKEANPSLEKIANIINLTKDYDFKVFSGNDNLVYPIMSLGGSGVISVCANIIPNIMHKICDFTDKDASLDLFLKYLPLMNALFVDVNPIMIKYAMNYLNYNVGSVRLPLFETTSSKKEKIEKVIDELL